MSSISSDNSLNPVWHWSHQVTIHFFRNRVPNLFHYPFEFTNTWRLRIAFSNFYLNCSPQFSIGLRLGLWGGHGSTSIFREWRNSRAIFDVWTGALSSWKMYFFLVFWENPLSVGTAYVESISLDTFPVTEPLMLSGTIGPNFKKEKHAQNILCGEWFTVDQATWLFFGRFSWFISCKISCNCCSMTSNNICNFCTVVA